MKPFLSIMTRCFKRPKQLERCIASVQNQTDQDYEQLFIKDDQGRGLFWANSQIFGNRHRVNGKWVYILDDDDYLTDSYFIEDLKKIDASNNIDIVICKGYIGDKLYPTYWSGPPYRGGLGSPNFIVKANLFKNYSENWCKAKAGDYFFIRRVYNYGTTYWWNKIVFKAPIGDGLPE
jgi:glycosyltransferase involved in cell wall biosynthesis